jgi:hypothetical protein
LNQSKRHFARRVKSDRVLENALSKKESVEDLNAAQNLSEKWVELA